MQNKTPNGPSAAEPADPQANRAKRLECVELAPAVERRRSLKAGASSTHSKRFALPTGQESPQPANNFDSSITNSHHSAQHSRSIEDRQSTHHLVTGVTLPRKTQVHSCLLVSIRGCTELLRTGMSALRFCNFWFVLLFLSFLASVENSLADPAKQTKPAVLKIS